MLFCNECLETVERCERCKRPFVAGDASTCGILNRARHYHSHTEKEKCDESKANWSAT